MMTTSTSNLEKPLSNIRLISTCIVLIIISVLSLIPPSQPSYTTHLDKVLHMIAYGILTTPYAFASKAPRLFVGSTYIYVYRIRLLFFVGFWGILLEIIQGYVGRTTDIWDLLANFIGSLCAIGLMPRLYRIFCDSFTSETEQ